MLSQSRQLGFEEIDRLIVVLAVLAGRAMSSARVSCKKRPASSQSAAHAKSAPLRGVERETGFGKLIHAPNGPQTLEELLGWSVHVSPRH